MDTRRTKRKPSLDPIEDFPSSTQDIHKRLKQKLKLKPAESSPPSEFAGIQFAQPQEPSSLDDYVPSPLPPLSEEKAPKPAAAPVKVAAPIPAPSLERTLSWPTQFNEASLSQTSQEHFQLPDGEECAQDPYKDLSPIGASSGSKRV